MNGWVSRVWLINITLAVVLPAQTKFLLLWNSKDLDECEVTFKTIESSISRELFATSLLYCMLGVS